MSHRVVFGLAIEPCGVFGGKKKFFSRHAVDQSLPYRVLAACVSEGGVEIIESRVEKHIHHSLDSFNVDDALFLRQSHKTEAELFDVVKIFCHDNLLWTALKNGFSIILTAKKPFVNSVFFRGTNNAVMRVNRV